MNPVKSFRPRQPKTGEHKMGIFTDINFQVGSRLQMSLQHGAMPVVYYTELIGYVDGNYLIVKIPFENGLSIQVQVDDTAILRILVGVDIYTLTCKIKTIFKSPHYYMHLNFPSEIKSTALRSAIRAKVNLPVRVNGVAGAGVITDISITGAAISADRVLGEINKEALISFDFPVMPANQIVHIHTGVTIRRIQEIAHKKQGVQPKLDHGILFNEIAHTSQVMLLNFIYESMNKTPAVKAQSTGKFNTGWGGARELKDAKHSNNQNCKCSAPL